MMSKFKRSINPKNLVRKEAYITGRLNPIEWDEKDQIKKFSIYSDIEEDIIIEHYRNFQKLKSLLNQRVLAIGHTYKKNGELYMRPRIIRKLTNPSSSVLKFSKEDYWNEELKLAYPYTKYVENDILELGSAS